MATLIELKLLVAKSAQLSNKDFSDQLLSNILNASGHNVQQGLERLSNYVHNRKNYPKLFGVLSNAVQDVLKDNVVQLLTLKSPVSGEAIIMIQMKNWNTDKYEYEEILAAVVAVLEFKADVLSEKGVMSIMIADSLTFKQSRKISPSTSTSFSTLASAQLAVKINSSFLYTNTLAEVAWKLVKPFLKKEIVEAITLVGKKNAEKLHQKLPIEVAPGDLGDLSASRPDLNSNVHLQLFERKDLLLAHWDKYMDK